MITIFLSLTQSKVSCKNPYNSNVDWFAGVKVPTISDSIPNHASGLGFFYTDPNTRLSEASGDLGSTSGNPLYYSMQPMYQGKNSTYGYMLISDQPAHRTSTPSDTYAHKKGVLIYDSESGIYIEHSVPRYPNNPGISNTYEYPSTGTKYGQSFLCVNLAKSDIENWAQGMLVERGYVYGYNTPSFASSFAPSLVKINNGEWNDNTMTKKFTVKAGSAEFTHFSKNRKWGGDIYHDLIAPTFKAPVYSETWARGTGTFTSNCTGSYNAYNVLNVDFQGVSWGRMNDHSKWAVSGNHFCIGGINRQQKQLERGGGSWCKNDATLANTMMGVITEYEKCP